MKYSALFMIAVGLFFSIGCADKCEIIDKNGSTVKTFTSPASISKASTLDEATTGVANSLLNCSAGAIVKNSKIAVTSFVQNANVVKSSDFGRVFAETLSSKLRSKGASTVELKAQKAVLLSVTEQGEFALSRDAKNFRSSLSTPFVVVGVYDIVEDGLMVNARLVDLDSGTVLSSSMMMIANAELVDKSMPKASVKLVAQKKESSEASK